MMTTEHDRLMLLDAVIHDSDDAIATKTLAGVVTSWNPGAERIFGYTSKEIVGRPITILFPPDRLGEETEFLGRLSRGEHVAHYDTVRVRKDGSPIDVSVTLSPLRNTSGEIFGISKIARDITERKRAEALQREQLAKRAHELSEEQTARAEAEGISRRKDEFLTMLAHELRNPLASILNGVAALDRIGAQSSDAKHAREIVRRQTNLLAGLLEELLDVARVGQRKIDLHFELVDLRAIVAHAVETERHRFESRQQSCVMTQAPEPVVVLGDPVRIQQIVSNLLVNASKYTLAGGMVSAMVSAEGNDAVVRVRDNGVGIPADKLGEVFELFTQLASSQPNAQGGLGIGLTLAKQLTDLHGGSIAALSDGPGCGSEFVVRLPRRQDAPVQHDSVASVTRTSHHRVLIIDDNDDSREVLAMSLEIDGHRVLAAASGREGLEIALVERPDVIIVDIGLPDIDGHEVARRLRSALGPETMLVAFSGYAQPEDRRRSLEAGFDAHVVKPATVEAILDALARRPAPAHDAARGSRT
jgi:two-component system CheB/CheR fusion protein